MAFKMASLKRSKSGAYTARKGIPKDVREEYQRLYGQGWEARFSAEAGMSPSAAKASLGEWLAEIESRIGSIRSTRTGEGQSLTRMQTLGLAGEWYGWFVARHEDAPGDVERWEDLLNDLQGEELALAPAGFQGIETDIRDWAWTQAPKVRARMRPVISETAKVGEFLASKGLVLSTDARNSFLDVLDKEFVAAIRLLIRRSEDDYTLDEYPARFPEFVQTDKRPSASCISPKGLFDRWVMARDPARATVNRWRAIFLNLDTHFDGASIADISESDVRRWKDQLVTARRSAHTVSEVWLNAAKSVFEWAVKEDIIKSNPFAKVSITVPRKTRHRDTNAFTREEITIILAGSSAVTNVKTAFKAAKRWVPWLCAYTGARAGEITQLRVCDVIMRDGINALLITPEAGSTKSGTARTIPIHEHLIEQGFLDFVEECANGPLFYNAAGAPVSKGDPTNPKRPRAVKTRERLAKWVRKLGVTDTEIRPNHGWRHTFKQIADRHNISERVSDEITGHSPANVSRSYGRATLGDMASALKRFPRYEFS
jgi:integrase